MLDFGAGTAPAGFNCEIKFVVDAAVAAGIRDWARARLAPDPHGHGPFGDEYGVASLYFDTAARDVYHRRGSFGRSKYRIRRYHESSTVFLERKMRTGSRLAKRRTRLDLAALADLAGPGLAAGTAWFQRRLALRRLRPVCQVSYRRMARIDGVPGSPVRMTVDTAMAACANGTFGFHDDAGVPVLDGMAIVELKYCGQVPAVFRALVETFALSPRRSSKYRTAAAALGLVPTGGAPDAVHA